MLFQYLIEDAVESFLKSNRVVLIIITVVVIIIIIIVITIIIIIITIIIIIIIKTDQRVEAAFLMISTKNYDLSLSDLKVCD